MKKLYVYVLVIPMIMSMIACGEKTKSNPEVDSLKNALNDKYAEMSEMDLFLDVVNASMDSVLDLDGSVLRSVGESNLSKKEQIKQNIAAYKEILQRQRERLAELEKKLGDSDNQNVKLTEELEQRNFDINTLKENVAQLNTQVTTLEEDSRAKDEVIETQTNMLNEAYVCFGTKKMLKDAGVLSGGFLKKAKLNMSQVNPSVFTKIDIRQQNSFKIAGKKPEILTQAPAGSYKITDNGDGTSTLTITDAEKFWSMSNYLVVRY